MSRSAFVLVCAIALSFAIAPSFLAPAHADPPKKSKKKSAAKKKKKKPVKQVKPVEKRVVEEEAEEEEEAPTRPVPVQPSQPDPVEGAGPVDKNGGSSTTGGRQVETGRPATNSSVTQSQGEVAGSSSSTESTGSETTKSLSAQSGGGAAATSPSGDLAKTAPADQFDVGFDKGFFIRSADKKYRIQFGLESRVQGSVFQRKTPDPERVDPPSEGAIRPRSMQLLASGTAFERYGFTLAFGLGLDPDRPLDSSQMTLAFATAVVKPWLTFRSGLFVVPFGIEGSSYFFASRTIERSITVEAMAPGRDSGVAMMGEVAGGRLFYSAAIIGGSGVARIEPEDQPDGVFRLQGQPIMGKLKIGASTQVGKQPFNLIGGRVFATTRAQRDVLFDSPTAGLRQRYGADASLTLGPLAINTEVIYERAKRDDILNLSLIHI